MPESERRSLTLAGRRRAWHSRSGRASAVLPAADGNAASAALAPPRYVPGRSAPLQPAGVRGAGPPAAPAYVCERMCEVGGGGRASVPTQPAGTKFPVPFLMGLGCPYQMLLAASCLLWDRNSRGLGTSWIIAVLNESLTNLVKNEFQRARSRGEGARGVGTPISALQRLKQEDSLSSRTAWDTEGDDVSNKELSL